MSVAEQGMLMTSMLKRMDRYYPLLCDQAAVIKPEYQVIASNCAVVPWFCPYLAACGLQPCYV
jgi:hypothetical protein